MKKITLLILFCITHTINGSTQLTKPIEQKNVCKSFFYGSVGGGCLMPFPFLLPGIGLGYRYQHNHIGFDLSADFSTLFIANMLKLSPGLLFYPFPKDGSEFYCGLACGGLYINVLNIYRPGSTHHLFFLPELVGGYQYKMNSGREGIVELRLGFPISPNHNKDCNNYGTRIDRNPIFPCASIKFGFSF